MIKLNVSSDARPQVRTLLICALVAIALWYVPFLSVLSYPFNLFVTFIHEGGHALAALLTGNSVSSLSVAYDASGATYATQGGFFSQVIVSSAGYLGAMTYGALLLVLIRRAVAARYVLMGSAAFILALTIIYGMGDWFTIIAGFAIPAGLIAVAAYSSPRAASFFVSFLAVQSILNALLDLKTLFFLSFVPGQHSDAVNMYNATGIHSIVWSVVWIALACVILSMAMRAYSANCGRNAKQQDLPFEEPLGV